MPAHSRRVAASLLALGLACASLAGCTGDTEPEPGPTPSTAEETTVDAEPTTTAPADDPCEVLDAAAVAELAGTELTPAASTVAEIPACLWGALDDVAVQVARVGADVWANQIPAIVDQVREVGILTDEQVAKLDDAVATIEAGGTIDADEACELFTTLLVTDGEEEGTDLTVRFVPDASHVLAISGQACVDGTYASVLLVRPDLEGTEAEASAVEDAVDAALAAG